MRLLPPGLAIRRRLAVVVVGVALAASVTTIANAATIGFGQSLLTDAQFTRPTSLQFGPDGRLYVAQQDGLIRALTVVRDGSNAYRTTASESIGLIQSIPNHDDDGAPNTSLTTRMVTGLLVTGTSSAPVIYVTSSDPRAGGPQEGDLGLDTNSGVISRLTRSGGVWQRTDLVRGLPRSEFNHVPNGMALDLATNTLYVTVGGNTNMGAPSRVFAELPEYALSAAILSVDLTAIGSTTYDLPTLNDDTRPGQPDANDPFGGNDGRNQAILMTTGPVRLHASGFRNAYDVLIASTGRMYAIDNASNANEGGMPVGEGPQGACTNAVVEPGTTTAEALHLVTGAGYYGGHPNPTRGNTDNTFNTPPQSPVPAERPGECDFRTPGFENGALTTWSGSFNGLTEYTASNFGGDMQGDLLAAGWDDVIARVELGPGGTSVTSNTTLFANPGSRPLDIIATGDAGPFPGTVWATDWGTGRIMVFEPNDFGGGGGTCTGADRTDLDEDADGFTNADEIDNSTNPCSAADRPADRDGDRVSDLNDPDDDNDGLPDTSDPFAIDPQNGLTSNLPISITWDASAPAPGGLQETGFTGLMTNGATNYHTLFDGANMTVGGAPGVLVIDRVPAGDATAARNSQAYAFQRGVRVVPSAGPFTVHTTIVGPFAGLVPQDEQSMGIALGTGGQDDHVSLVTTANGGAGGIRFSKEVGGTRTVRPVAAVAMPGPDLVDLYLRVDPAAGTVQPSYRVTSGGVPGSRVDLGATEPIPASWVSGASGLAVGIIATSFGAAPFPASWDVFDVAYEQTGPGAWSSRTAVPTARKEISFVQAGGKMYLAGGGSTLHQVYDPATNAWTTAAPLPAALDHFMGVTTGGRIYYVGGIGTWPTGSVGNVAIYDPATNAFTSGAPMSRPRGAGGTAVHDGRIYYAGGLAGGTIRPWFDVYDPATNTWSALPDMPAARHHFHPVVIGNRMYVIGGRQASPPTGTVAQTAFAYDFTTGSWSTLPAPPARFADYAAASIGTKVFIFGGHSGGIPQGATWSFDTISGQWTQLAPMLAARFSTQASVWNGEVYIAGGGTTGGGATTRHEVFSPSGGGSPPPPPTTVRQPDGTIRLQADASAIGNGTYNTTGTGQTRSISTARGTTRWFVVRIQNDGTTPDAFTVQGTGNLTGFVGRYFLGTSGTATELTSAIVGGTYSTGTLSPGQDHVFRLRVFVQQGAAIGTTGTWSITARSAADGTRVDVVRAQATVT